MCTIPMETMIVIEINLHLIIFSTSVFSSLLIFLLSLIKMLALFDHWPSMKCSEIIFNHGAKGHTYAIASNRRCLAGGSATGHTVRFTTCLQNVQSYFFQKPTPFQWPNMTHCTSAIRLNLRNIQPLYTSMIHVAILHGPFVKDNKHIFQELLRAGQCCLLSRVARQAEVQVKQVGHTNAPRKLCLPPGVVVVVDGGSWWVLVVKALNDGRKSLVMIKSVENC